MEMPKASDADKDRFRALVAERSDVEVKPMFGNLGAFVNGNMFAGLFGSSVGVKLPEGDLDELRAVDGSGPFGPSERPMGGYVALPQAWVDQPELGVPWVERALGYAASLPPKVKKGSQKAAS